MTMARVKHILNRNSKDIVSIKYEDVCIVSVKKFS